MEKYELLPEQLLFEGTVTKENFFTPGKMQEDMILRTHTPEYWDKLKSLQLTRKEMRKIGFPVRKDLVERGRFIAYGTFQCALYALEFGISMNVAGGTHHAYHDHGEGFCVFNDFALAANELLHQKIVQQILIIDLDVHQGNGTAHIFRNESSVFTFSMHGAKNYPVRKEESDLDIGLEDGTKDEEYLEIVNEVVPGLLERVKPDLVFYLAGVDILESDQLGRLSLTRAGCKERDLIVLSACQKTSTPVAVSMGGGYSREIRDIIDAHANTFRIAQFLYF